MNASILIFQIYHQSLPTLTHGEADGTFFVDPHIVITFHRFVMIRDKTNLSMFIS